MVFCLYLLCMGLWFGIKLRFFCFLHPVRCVKAFFKRKREGGTYSPGKALTVALAGTLGVGNITGVAAAMALGGAGALFWMWISALLTMLIKYTEVTLAVKYRRKEGNSYRGGPMRYLRMVPAGKILAPAFCVFCVTASFLQGNLIQTNAAAVCISETFGVRPLITGVCLTVCAAVLVFGGRDKIGAFTEKMIPFMTALYTLMGLYIMIKEAGRFPEMLCTVVKGAFSPKAAAGGGVLWLAAVRHGCAKGVFSHEAGCGTAPISHAGAETDSAARQGLLGIMEVAVDTLLLCSVTGFVLLLSGIIPPAGLSADTDPVPLVIRAFSLWFGKTAAPVLTLSMTFFAFATLVCWSFYGTEALSGLTNSAKAKRIYLILFSLCTVCGVFGKSTVLWRISDLLTVSMTAINTAGVSFLLPKILTETRALYERKM